MTPSPIEPTLRDWHAFLAGDRPEALDRLLADDVVFYSPIVYTPQRGKAITTAYLRAAQQVLGGEGGFRYTKQVVADTTAVLEFETAIEGTYVNGVDIMRCDEDGRIIEFRVMIRPLQAVTTVHQRMRAMLEAIEN